MQNMINANILAQIANNQIEEDELITLLHGLYESIPSEDAINCDFDRLFAANRLSKANKMLLDSFKKKVCELLKSPKGFESRTKVIGDRMFKLYYITSCTWENCRLPEKNEADKTDKDRQIEAELALYNDLYDRLSEAETAISILKQKKKASEETLAALMPNSKCIHRSPVIQML